MGGIRDTHRWPHVLLTVLLIMLLVGIGGNKAIARGPPVVITWDWLRWKWCIWWICGDAGHMDRCGRIGTHSSQFLQESIYGSLKPALRLLQHLLELALQLARHLGDRVLDPL